MGNLAGISSPSYKINAASPFSDISPVLNGIWRSVALSDNGSVVVSGNQDHGWLYVSTNGGSSWTARIAQSYWREVFVSPDGQTILVADNATSYLYKSVNGGTSFTTLPSAGYYAWMCVYASADCNYILAGAWESREAEAPDAINYNRDLWKSSNGGTNFSKVTAVGVGLWQSCFVSGTGQYQLASSRENLWRSTDYGVTWAVCFNSAYIHRIRGIRSAETLILGTSSGVYVSNDYGVTWTKQNLLGDFKYYSVAISANKIMVAGSDGGNLYISLNGVDWWAMTASAAVNWRTMAFSYDETTLIAGQFTGAGPYTGKLYKAYGSDSCYGRLSGRNPISGTSNSNNTATGNLVDSSFIPIITFF